MALFSMTDCTTWIDDYDFTGDLNKVTFDVEVDELETTVFGGGGYRSRVGGLRSVSMSGDGFWQAGTNLVDAELVPDLGTADKVVTISPTGVAGATAYMAQLGKFKTSLFGGVGEVAPFSLECSGTNNVGVVRGQVTKAKGTVSATGALGSGPQIGAVSATQYLYGTLHLFGTAATTITVVLESDDNSGFTTATTRATLGPLTASGGTWATRTAGAITDDYFRYRVTAVTGTWTVAGAIGVQ